MNDFVELDTGDIEIMELFASYVVASNFLDDEPPAKRQVIERNYENSVWGKLLRDPTIREPGMFAFVKFCTRFRTPYPLFEDFSFLSVKNEISFP